MTRSHQELVERAIAAYREVAHSWSVPAAMNWLGLDLTIAQLKTLIVLAHEQPLTVGHVGELLGIGLPAASHLIDRLVQSGLAERSEDPADRRRTLVRLSSQGGELTQRLWYESQDRLRGRFALVSDDDLAALVQGLRAIAAVPVSPVVDDQDACRADEAGEREHRAQGAAVPFPGRD